ncbi:MAG TPA: NUDIX hydrolase [Pseudonocardia sp.]|nr:NUDIX hydrolase [Pseudonocardia sp.]
MHDTDPLNSDPRPGAAQDGGAQHSDPQDEPTQDSDANDREIHHDLHDTHDSEVDVVAAGGVLWRPGPGERPEMALVHRPRYDDWSLPKGKLERGETAPVAAVREIAEETGFNVQLGHQLGEVFYQVPEGRKVVHWWSARAVSGAFAPGPEVDELRWLAPDAARQQLTYPHEREVLDRFLQLTPSLTTLLLVRHAKAGNREDWNGDDDKRPLTTKGRAQAERLVTSLGLFGPTRVYAAPPLRCVDTVGPIAAAVGTEVQIEPRFSEDGYWEDPEAGLARLLEIVAEPGVAVVCSQGEVIPDLIGLLTGEEDPPFRKASTWALGFAGTEVVTSDYYPPPKPPTP